MNTQIIAAILSQLGFATRITSIGVIVSLNRRIDAPEVETALEQEFEEIGFNVSRISSNQVMVQEYQNVTNTRHLYAILGSCHYQQRVGSRANEPA